MPDYSKDVLLFSFKDLIHLIPDIQLPRIHYLIKKGWVQPYFSPTGRGSSRVYSDGDILLLAVFNLLIESGIDLNKHGQAIKENAEEFYLGVEGIKEKEVLLLRGREMVFTTPNKLKILFHKKNYQPQVIVPIGLMKQDIDARIDKLILKKKCEQKK